MQIGAVGLGRMGAMREGFGERVEPKATHP